MIRKICQEVEVKSSLTKTWEVYSTSKITTIIQSKLSHLFKVDVLEGDGGVGTIIKVTPQPGVSNVIPYKEKYTKIDNEKKVKEVEIIEGGYLELGLTSCRMTFELMENQKENSGIVRATIEYEGNEDVIKNTDASIFTIKPLMNVLEVVNQCIQKTEA